MRKGERAIMRTMIATGTFRANGLVAHAPLHRPSPTWHAIITGAAAVLIGLWAALCTSA